MKRTDADANVANRFYDGNPALGEPATVVEETWLNNVQEEICNVVEAAGIVLDEGDETQLLQALAILVPLGGSVAPLSASILNNQASAVNLTGFLFDGADFKSVVLEFTLERRTDSTQFYTTGTIKLVYDTFVGAWRDPAVEFDHEDPGVVFTVTSVGQVQYTSDNLAGSNYTSTIDAVVRKIAQ